jgi:hypothetical protein
MHEIEVRISSNPERRDHWIECSVFAQCSWLAALRGNETMMIDLGDTRMLWTASIPNQAKHPHAPIAIKGKFKASISRTCHIMLLSCKTRSKVPLNVRENLKRMLNLEGNKSRSGGWLFAKPDGRAREMSYFENDILEVIADIQEREKGIIPEDLDVYERYGVFRSFRRGASTEARNGKVKKEDIELNNGWRKVESARGKHVSADMLSYYTDSELAVEALLRFSSAV